MYGEDQLYGGGLSVRTTLEPKMQDYARKALMDGLVNYDHGTGFRGPVATVDISSGDWGPAVATIKPLGDVPEWTLGRGAVDGSGDQAQIGLRPGQRRRRQAAARPQDRARSTAPTPSGSRKKLSTILKRRRRRLRLAGRRQGRQPTRSSRCRKSRARWSRWTRAPAACWRWSAASPTRESEFNRATQAMRQPGSSFKPIVYSAALDNGYTPASVVLDAPIEIVNSDGTVWKPDNFEKDFKGPQTLRRGIELSRNVMTVRLAQDIGMPLIVEYAKMFGIYDNLTPVLAMALGAGETTDLKMTAAYATIANGGRKIVPTLIDRIQDRYGKTIYQHDDRVCDGCNATALGATSASR